MQNKLLAAFASIDQPMSLFFIFSMYFNQAIFWLETTNTHLKLCAFDSYNVLN